LWLLAAIGWHALVDAIAVFAGVSTGVYAGSIPGTAITEILIAGVAGISLLILLRLRPATEGHGPPRPAPLPHTGPVAGVEPGDDRLASSRFSGEDGVK
jgi:hypothetical protein